MAKFIQRRHISRRHFLRGAGVCLALPVLDGMLPALASAEAESALDVRRALFVFTPNGQKMDDWKPRRTGRFQPGYILKPLEKYRQSINLISGLAIKGGLAQGDGPGDHARAGASFLTCAHPKKTGGADIRAGISVDQVIAEQLGQDTTFKSLQLGMERGRRAGICDSGYSCAYSNNISWRSATTPIVKETDPRAFFTRLFGDPDEAFDAAAENAKKAKRRSIIDAAWSDAKSLRRKLSHLDRTKLDDYLTSVRELEKRLARIPKANATAIEVPESLRQAASYPERLALMYELIALAFEADLTRCITFMTGNAGSNRSYRFLGISDGHHDVSHHGKKPEQLKKYRQINRFHAEKFGQLLGHLEGKTEGNKSLLHQSMVLYGSGFGDGNSHDHRDIPVLVAGQIGGRLKTGRHVQVRRMTPMADLYLTLMKKLGVKAKSFADSEGKSVGI